MKGRKVDGSYELIPELKKKPFTFHPLEKAMKILQAVHFIL